jgi:hypothetical protein
MNDRTEIIETTPRRTEVVETTPPVTEVVTSPRPVTAVDQTETVAYDPYEARRVAARRTTQIVYWLFGLIIGLIAIRFVLKALGANPSAGFAEFIYGITNILVAPFAGLFSNPQSGGMVLELTSLVAIVVYGLLAWLIGKLVWIMMGETRSEVRARSTSVDSRT